MLISILFMVRMFDRVDSTTKLGKILECTAFLIAWINFPFVIASGILGLVWLEAIPVWTRLAFAGIVFWASWHLILRYMRRWSLKNMTESLHLSKHIDRSDGL